MRVGELSEIAGKGLNRKDGKRNKYLKKGGKLGQGVDPLKREEGWNPLANYDYH